MSMTLREMKETAHGTVIGSFIGTVDYVGDTKTDKYEKEWQQISLLDSEGEKISGFIQVGPSGPIQLADKGKTFRWSSKATSTHGMQGVKVLQNGQYTNLRITGSAERTPYYAEGTPSTKSTSNGVKEQARGGNAAPASEVAQQMADFALLVRTQFALSGMDHIADEAALRAPAWAAQWWFGERGMVVEEAVNPETEDDVPF